MKKRILSMLLALTMIVGMIPATTMTANAATRIGIATWEELETALTSGTGGYYRLMDDLECKHEDHYESTKYHRTTYIKGDVTLDLNGHSIKCKDEENDISLPPLFVVSSGATLTINDTVGDGIIQAEGYIAGTNGGLQMGTTDRREYIKFLSRDIFSLQGGTLIVNGGTIQAGNVSKQWIMDGVENPGYRSWKEGENIGSEFIGGDRYDGYARQQVSGTAVEVGSGAKLVVNGGKLSGRGMTGTSDSPSYAVRDEVVYVHNGGSVIVNDGSFTANGGANVFAGDGVESGLTVRGGDFKTDKHDKIRVLDFPGHLQGGNATDRLTEVVITGSYGNLGIPDSAWKNVPFRIQVIQNDTTLTGYGNLNALSLDKTGGQTSGKSLEVTILPYVSGKEMLTVNGGPYNNSLSADTTFKINYTDIDVTADYEPYFKDTTGLENYSITYTWSVYNNFSGSGGIKFNTNTTTNTLNLEDALRANTGSAAFKGTLTVKCTVVEQASNGSFLPIITEFFSAKFENIKTPLTEDALPGGKMDTVITYPDGSSGKTPVLITVKPLASQLAQDAYGNCTVEYQYDFRSWTGGTTKTYSNTGKLDCFALDCGHVKVATTMIVYGSEGQGRRFTDEAWALVLPEITATGGSWDSGKTAIIGSPGTRVMLKAPIDTVNAAVAADKITASDIEGWYKITYDSNGDEVYTYVSGSKGYATIGILTGGTYCYAAKDRDGNKVYSAPVKVQFSADAYSIKITRTPTDYSFYVCPDWANPVAQDITFTATIGSSVAKSNVWWKIVNAPQGFDISTMSVAPIIINANRGLTPNFSDFIKNANLKSIPVGTYAVQAFVYKDGSYLSASNIIYVDVKRAESFVDITDAYGNVLSETTMEGPANGTMQLNCVPGNGGSNPVLKSVTWKVESLVGTNVATIDKNGLLTINKPGQIKVTATVTQESGEIVTLKSNTQYVIINIPITEVEVTLGTPALGGDPASIASVSADAPYQVVYHVNKWASGVSTKGVFMANGIPELCVTIAPKNGYVFPARQLYLENYDESWYTYADDMVVKVNGTSYNFRDFETTFTDGSSQYNGDYGTWYEAQSIDFHWKWDRLRDPSSTYLDYVNLTAPIPEVGHVRDLAPEDEYTSMLPICTNNSSIFTWVNGGGIYKVSGDYLNDNDETNDNAVQMGETETYQMAQTYRADIYFNTNANRDGTFFAENVTLMINGQKCHIETLQGSTNLDGQDLAVAYYYFIPTAEIQTIDMLWIDDLEAPVGYQKPATADDITEFSSNFIVDDEVCVTRLTWFYDVNNNGVIDTGEDSADSFNADGSFIAGLRYSVYVELEARDRDDDGKGDYVKFADNAVIKLTSQGNAKMTGNHNGAVYKFPAATMPKTAVTVDPNQLVIELDEGYTGRPIKTIKVNSVGTTELTSITAEAEDASILDVKANGMSINVLPADYGFAKGTYSSSVIVKDTS
ncbi:MAG: hypothetical protein IKJ66_00580, partial [Bacteroidaceae bacterium]|nr:hypothetical protein [Bacteroidaceae bacterium]